MLVVIHKDQAVGIVGEVLVVEVVVVGRDVDVHLQSARVEVGGQLADQGVEAGLGGARKVLKVDRNALKFGVGSQKS